MAKKEIEIVKVIQIGPDEIKHNKVRNILNLYFSNDFIEVKYIKTNQYDEPMEIEMCNINDKIEAINLIKRFG